MQTLAYAAAALMGLWRIAHVVPTRQVLAGFEPLTVNNGRILAQEWLVEAFTIWGLSCLIIVVTTLEGDGIAPHGSTASPPHCWLH